MTKINEIYSEYRDYILFGVSIVVFSLLSFFIFYYFNSNINRLDKEIEERPVVEVKTESKDKEKYVIDIKGEVKKPGVYFLDKGKRVIDVVNKAGGFTKEADSFVNNLSMKITDEMVIVVYSKSEINDYLNTKKQEKQKLEKCKQEIIANNSCIESTNDKELAKDNSTKESTKRSSDAVTESNNSDDSNKKISINTASKEELMTLSGIGESKALAIIEYRKSKQFETIEEIKEVSGIGDALFEKIKDFITT